jgi:hypothetical protein
MAGKATQQNTHHLKNGTLVTGGFRLLDADGRVIKEGHLPTSPRVEVPIEYSEVYQ